MTEKWRGQIAEVFDGYFTVAGVFGDAQHKGTHSALRPVIHFGEIVFVRPPMPGDEVVAKDDGTYEHLPSRGAA